MTAPKKTVAKNKTKMTEYSITMVIPTGPFANIQPRIVVESTSPEEAHEYIAPHMNKLWKEYFLVNERRPETTKPKAKVEVKEEVKEETKPNYVPLPGTTTSTTDAPMTIEEIAKETGGKVVEEVEEVQPPDSGVALIKATQAINSCFSIDALEIIQAQVLKSVKLSEVDKEALMPLILAKSAELAS